jgi:D-threonine aldolase
MSADQPWYVVENAAEVPSPSILLYPDRVAENLRRMIAGAGGADRLRPHVKTHKLPQIVQLKREMGINKFKTSTIAEAEMTAAAGGADVLLAYPPVGPNIERFARLIKAFPATRFSALVDHPRVLADLSQTALQAGVTFELFLDLNVGMDRTGIVPGPAAFELYLLMSAAPNILVRGLHAYDGHVIHSDPATLQDLTRKTFEPVWRLRDELIAAGHVVPSIVASGTPTFPRFGAHPEVEVGCGTTVLWDFGQAAVCPDLDFLNAAVVLTRVVSKPLTDLVCIDLGHKAVASEMPHPRVKILGLDDAQFVRHSEEHLVFRTSAADRLQPGDVLYGIPCHICPTVALHQEAWVVRDGRVQEAWPIVSRARRITI